MAIFFSLLDFKINRPIACKNSDTFVSIEEKLYNEYPELKNNENFFLVNGRKIKRFLTIDENNIKDGDSILIYNINYTKFYF